MNISCGYPVLSRAALMIAWFYDRLGSCWSDAKETPPTHIQYMDQSIQHGEENGGTRTSHQETKSGHRHLAGDDSTTSRKALGTVLHSTTLLGIPVGWTTSFNIQNLHHVAISYLTIDQSWYALFSTQNVIGWNQVSWWRVLHITPSIFVQYYFWQSDFVSHHISVIIINNNYFK